MRNLIVTTKITLLTVAAWFAATGCCVAQTCENPLALPPSSQIAGNTATSANNVPAVANGTISTSGNDIVYRAHFGPPYGASIVVQPQYIGDVGIFLCRACHPAADCVAFADANMTPDGSETLNVSPTLEGWFYLIVDNIQGEGGPYLLNVITPL